MSMRTERRPGRRLRSAASLAAAACAVAGLMYALPADASSDGDRPSRAVPAVAGVDPKDGSGPLDG